MHLMKPPKVHVLGAFRRNNIAVDAKREELSLERK